MALRVSLDATSHENVEGGGEQPLALQQPFFSLPPNLDPDPSYRCCCKQCLAGHKEVPLTNSLRCPALQDPGWEPKEAQQGWQSRTLLCPHFLQP